MGSGRVASHLAPALVRGGWRCSGVWSRTAEHAEALARRLGTDGTADRERFLRETEADLLLLCVTDDALRELARELPEGLSATVLHTSGSTGMSVLGRCSSYGVLYPLQTFSLSRPVDMSLVPLFVEWHDERAEQLIRRVAAALGTRELREVSSEERQRLHLAACLACNFTNHLYTLASDVLRGSSVHLTDLLPLMEETLSKAVAADDPATVQTGPAVRDDRSTMAVHRALLAPELVPLYDLLTRSIQHRAQSNHP